MIKITPSIALNDADLEFEYLRSSGPGGQNVNKVATACQLRVNVYALGLDLETFKRLKTLAGSRMTTDGELIILARRYRTQEGNRADARERLSALIDAALVRPERRIKTKPSKAAKARRVDSKKARSSVKAGRGRVRGSD